MPPPRPVFIFSNHPVSQIKETLALLSLRRDCKYQMQRYKELEPLTKAMAALNNDQRKWALLLTSSMYRHTLERPFERRGDKALKAAGEKGMTAIMFSSNSGFGATQKTTYQANPYAGLYVYDEIEPEIFADLIEETFNAFRKRGFPQVLYEEREPDVFKPVLPK